jgi:hypothetical protein
MTVLSLLLTFWGLINNQNILQLGFLKHLIFRQALTKDLTKLFGKYDLRKKIIAYVKNERSNLNTMIITLKFIVSYDILGLPKSFSKVVVLAYIL